MQAKEQSLQVETSRGPYQLAFKLSDNPLVRNCPCGFRSRELNHLARPVAKKPAKLQQSWDLRHFLRPGFSQIQTSPVARSAARIAILIMYYPITSNMICIYIYIYLYLPGGPELAVSLPKERGAAAPAADHQKHLKSPAFYGVFCCSHFSTLVA